jgi:hypothetical protein
MPKKLASLNEVAHRYAVVDGVGRLWNRPDGCSDDIYSRKVDAEESKVLDDDGVARVVVVDVEEWNRLQTDLEKYKSVFKQIAGATKWMEEKK